jgi:hypothetical protein
VSTVSTVAVLRGLELLASFSQTNCEVHFRSTNRNAKSSTLNVTLIAPSHPCDSHLVSALTLTACPIRARFWKDRLGSRSQVYHRIQRRSFLLLGTLRQYSRGVLGRWCKAIQASASSRAAQPCSKYIPAAFSSCESFLSRRSTSKTTRCTLSHTPWYKNSGWSGDGHTIVPFLKSKRRSRFTQDP